MINVDKHIGIPLKRGGAAMKKKYPKALIDSASIDEIMLLYVKGERGR